MRRFSIDRNSNDREEHEALIRRQFVVRDEQDFITSFDPADGDTLRSVVCDLVSHFHAPDGEGYGGTDMVVWNDGRIVALVRKGHDGHPHPTLFRSEQV